MRKKDSYMDKNNILSEGVLDTIIKYLTQYPKLKNNKEFKSGLKDLNKGQQRLEDLIRFNIIQAGEIHVKEHRNLWIELKDNLERFESLDVDCPVMEGIVVDYDDSKYKLTGAFPSMNRCCGTVRYALGINFETEKESTFANAY